MLNDRLVNDVRRNGMHSSGTDDDRVLLLLVHNEMCWLRYCRDDVCCVILLTETRLICANIVCLTVELILCTVLAPNMNNSRIQQVANFALDVSKVNKLNVDLGSTIR